MPFLDQIIASNEVKYVLGLDEVATGAFAGPIFAAGVLLPVGVVTGAKDSKRYPAAHKLHTAAETFRTYPHHIAVGSVADIDTRGQSKTLNTCYLEVIEHMQRLTDENILVIVDGRRPVADYKGLQIAIPKADARVSCVSTASVLAKSMQLQWAAYADQEYPEYGFHKHHGYGTTSHRKCLEELGVTPWHRTSVATIKAIKARNDKEE